MGVPNGVCFLNVFRKRKQLRPTSLADCMF